MAGKKQLPPVRLVAEGEQPDSPKSLSEAFADGDRLAELLAKRRILIAHIESGNTLARDLNALMIQDDKLSQQIAEENAIRNEAAAKKRSEVSVVNGGGRPFDPYSA